MRHHPIPPRILQFRPIPRRLLPRQLLPALGQDLHEEREGEEVEEGVSRRQARGEEELGVVLVAAAGACGEFV